jgi:hypothetical protein
MYWRTVMMVLLFLHIREIWGSIPETAFIHIIKLLSVIFSHTLVYIMTISFFVPTVCSLPLPFSLKSVVYEVC